MMTKIRKVGWLAWGNGRRRRRRCKRAAIDLTQLNSTRLVSAGEREEESEWKSELTFVTRHTLFQLIFFLITNPCGKPRNRQWRHINYAKVTLSVVVSTTIFRSFFLSLSPSSELEFFFSGERTREKAGRKRDRDRDESLSLIHIWRCRRRG